MPRGAPDYSNVWSSSPLHRLDDMAEMAARLGSPNVYDRSGFTIWMTDFESGLQGSIFGTDHTDNKGSISSARSFHGNFSVKLDPRDVAESYIYWSRILHFIRAGKTGYEYSISLDSHPDQLRTIIFYHDEDEITEASLHYYPDTGLWRIVKAGPAWHTVLEDYKLQTGPAAWHSIKLVLDLENKKFVRAQIDKYVVDLSDCDIHTYGEPHAGQVEMRIQVMGEPANHAPIYIDGVIVTQGEP